MRTLQHLHVVVNAASLCLNHSTILTRNYAPFDYKAPFTICKNLLQRYIYIHFMPPLTIHNYHKNGRSLPLQQLRGRLELTLPPYVESSYLLASDTPTKRLAVRQQARS